MGIYPCRITTSGALKVFSCETAAKRDMPCMRGSLRNPEAYRHADGISFGEVEGIPSAVFYEDGKEIGKEPITNYRNYNSY